MGYVMCCQTPGKSENLQSIIFAPCFSAYFRTSLGVMSSPKLDGVFALLARPDADHLVDGGHEDLAVADTAGLGGLGDRGQHLVNHVVLDDDLDLDLGHEVDDVRRASVHLLLPPGSPEALHFGDRHSLDTDGAQALLHFVELERLDDGLDLLHRCGSPARFLP